MKGTTTRAVLGAAAIALSLAGCTGGDAPSGSPSTPATTLASPPATHSASPTATATTTTTTTTTTATTTTAAIDCPTWNDASVENGLASIDFNRFAGICVGMNYPEAAAASGLDIGGVAACPWVAEIVNDPAGLYVAALSSYDDPGASINFFHMLWMKDPSTASSYEMPATAEGITIGSTLAQMQAAYPSATHYTIDDMSRGPRDEWVVPGTNGNEYIFDVIDGLVSELNWGQLQPTGIQGEYCAL